MPMIKEKKNTRHEEI